MKIAFVVLNAALAASVLLSSSGVSARSHDIELRQRELALLLCLRSNYREVGVDIGAHDFSQFHDRYATLKDRKSPEYDLKLLDFVRKQTSNFHKIEVSVKAENTPSPHNAIFASCMKFFESKELKAFVKRNPL